MGRKLKIYGLMCLTMLNQLGLITLLIVLIKGIFPWIDEMAIIIMFFSSAWAFRVMLPWLGLEAIVIKREDAFKAIKPQGYAFLLSGPIVVVGSYIWYWLFPTSVPWP